MQIGCDPKHDSTFTLTGFLIQVNKEQEVKLEKQEFRLEKQQAQLDQMRQLLTEQTMLLKEERLERNKQIGQMQQLLEQNNRFERNIMFAVIALIMCIMFWFQKRNEKRDVLQQRTPSVVMKGDGINA